LLFFRLSVQYERQFELVERVPGLEKYETASYFSFIKSPHIYIFGDYNSNKNFLVLTT